MQFLLISFLSIAVNSKADGIVMCFVNYNNEEELFNIHTLGISYEIQFQQSNTFLTSIFVSDIDKVRHMMVTVFFNRFHTKQGSKTTKT